MRLHRASSCERPDLQDSEPEVPPSLSPSLSPAPLPPLPPLPGCIALLKDSEEETWRFAASCIRKAESWPVAADTQPSSRGR